MTRWRYLLDTHILIWALDQHHNIPVRYLPLLENGETCAVSIVPIWEIAIKRSLGKLRIRDDFGEFVALTGVEIIQVNLAHVAMLERLPFHHRDPFDRMLIAQAKMRFATSPDSRPQFLAL